MYTIKTSLKEGSGSCESYDDSILTDWLRRNLGEYTNVEKINELEKEYKICVTSYTDVPFTVKMNKDLTDIMKNMFDGAEFIGPHRNEAYTMLMSNIKSIQNTTDIPANLTAVIASRGLKNTQTVSYMYFEINLITRPKYIFLKEMLLDVKLIVYKMSVDLSK